MRDLYYYLASKNYIEVKKNFVPIVYFDSDGISKIYEISFFTRRQNRKIEWIENIPNSDLRPKQKYIYARGIAETRGIIFRGLSKEEVEYLNCGTLKYLYIRTIAYIKDLRRKIMSK